MFSLIQNEWIKLWNRKQSWFFLIAIALFSIGAVVIYQTFITETMEEPLDDWEAAIETEIAEQQEILESGTEEEWVLTDAERIIEENEQMLAAGVNPHEMNNAVFMNETFLVVASFITLFSVIIASTIVSSELDGGTLKHLFIRPFERWQFLLAKFITVVLFSISLIATLFVTMYAMGTVVIGAGSFSTPVSELNFEGAIVYTTVDAVLPAKIGLYFLNMLMFVIISFSISILFKSQTLAVGIGIFILFGTSISQVLTFTLGEYTWYKLMFLPHLNLPSYATMDEILPGVGLGFSLTVLAVYAVIILGSATIYFQKRDLA